MHILNSASVAQTVELGRLLGQLLRPEDVVGLVGDLGAGKTCMVRGIAQGLDIEPHYMVSSPTFTLINEYAGRSSLAHIDLYRLNDVDEMHEVGVFEYLGGPFVCVVEWFDRLLDEVSLGHLVVRFKPKGARRRRLEISGVGERHEALAQRWLDATRNEHEVSGSKNDEQRVGRTLCSR